MPTNFRDALLCMKIIYHPFSIPLLDGKTTIELPAVTLLQAKPLGRQKRQLRWRNMFDPYQIQNRILQTFNPANFQISLDPSTLLNLFNPTKLKEWSPVNIIKILLGLKASGTPLDMQVVGGPPTRPGPIDGGPAIHRGK